MDLLTRRCLWLTLPILIAISPLAAQISPGELSAAHEALEGVDNCTACHERGSEIGARKCLDCHENIQTVISAKHGMHFRLAGRSCNDCHKEHLGRSASITRFKESSFDHAETGFVLQGKHKGLSCEKCHRVASFRTERKAVSDGAKDKTFLGLRTDCVSCHADRHKATLGTNCQPCHAVDGWKPARGFDHAKTKFSLTGKHPEVACLKCHEQLAASPRPTPLLFSTKGFDDCTPCHASPHRAGFSARKCSECHTTTGWKSAEGFNHSATRFPLVGKHSAVACEKCHTSIQSKREGMKTDFTTKTFADCTPCHKTPHRPELSSLSCKGCHTPVAWGSVDVKQFDHGATGFPLRGKHITATCRSCHEGEKGRSQADRYHDGLHRCSDCHEDYHRGAFGSRYSDCASCHRETGFSPSTFSIADHAKSRFSLAGAHGAVRCIECHRKQGGSSLFSFADLTCTTCHRDQHNGAFTSLMGTNGCAHCHGTDNWKRVRFDHGRVGFSLAGRHAVVTCNQCHKTDGVNVRYRGTPKDCIGCHKDPHAGQFSDKGSAACGTCHTPNGWRRLTFDHETQSAFRLTGAHRNIQCGVCHKPELVGQNKVVRFKPLPKTCEACHQGGK